MKTINKEQDAYNYERIIDINLVLQYMESLDITKEYFTDIGIGHLRALGSLKDELHFISKDEYKKACKRFELTNKKLSDTNASLKGKYAYKCKECNEVKDIHNELLKDYKKLKKTKKKWFK